MGFFLLSISVAGSALADKTVYFKGFYNGTHVGSDKTGMKTGKISRSNITIVEEGPYNFGNAGGAAIGIKNGNFAFEIEAVASGAINSKNVLFKEVEADTIKVARHLLKNSDYEGAVASKDIKSDQDKIKILK